MVKEKWIEEWLTVEVLIHPEGEFDHFPLVLKSFNYEHKRKSFRFFNMWCQAEKFEGIVSQVWHQQATWSQMFQVASKLKLLKKDLKKLNVEQFDDVSIRNLQAHQEMVEAQTQLHKYPNSLDCRAQEHEARLNYIEAHKIYSSSWAR